MVSFDAQGKETSRRVFRYNRQGIQSWRELQANGYLARRGLVRFDNRGNKIESSEYNDRGSVDHRYLYTYDAREIRRVRRITIGTTLKVLLENGLDVNAKAYDGTTPLMMAAEGSDPSVVQLLINKGADVNAKANDGRTALGLVNRANREEVIVLLKKAGARERSVARAPSNMYAG